MSNTKRMLYIISTMFLILFIINIAYYTIKLDAKNVLAVYLGGYLVSLVTLLHSFVEPSTSEAKTQYRIMDYSDLPKKYSTIIYILTAISTSMILSILWPLTVPLLIHRLKVD